MDPEEGQHHPLAETMAAIDGLPDSYFGGVSEWAAWKLSYNGVAEAGDVISDAYARFAAGTRRWPIGVAIEVCFKNAVRSLISEAWEQHDRRRAQSYQPLDAEGLPLDPFENAIDPVDGQLQSGLRRNGLDVQAELDAEQSRLAAITSHIETSFAGDDAVTAVLIGLEQQLAPGEVQTAFGVSSTEYDSARRRLRRFLNKHYPNQWRDDGTK